MRAPDDVRVNARLDGALLEAIAAPDREGVGLLRAAAESMGLSARGYHRTLRLARTLADLDGEKRPRRPHVAEALGYRGRASRFASRRMMGRGTDASVVCFESPVTGGVGASRRFSAAPRLKVTGGVGGDCPPHRKENRRGRVEGKRKSKSGGVRGAASPLHSFEPRSGGKMSGGRQAPRKRAFNRARARARGRVTEGDSSRHRTRDDATWSLGLRRVG